MPIYLAIPLTIILSACFGAVIYIFGWIFLDPERNNWFFKVVPLYTKPKYAIALYCIAGLFYFAYTYGVWGYFSLRQSELVLITPICVVGAAHIVRLLAKWRHEDIEESREDEIRRKEAHKYDGF